MTRVFIVISLLLCVCFLSVGIHSYLLSKQVSHQSDVGVLTESAPLARMIAMLSAQQAMAAEQESMIDQYTAAPESQLFLVSHQSDDDEALLSEPTETVDAVQIQKNPRTDRYPVNIRHYEGSPTIHVQAKDPLQRQSQVACSTCHSVRQAKLANTAAQLDQFHQGFAFAHGQLTCYACHHAQQPDALRLADGQAVAYADVMTMCSQCHSQQAIAYQHGAHGGMNGFWDLSRGPQFKNNCVDCHDPHVPKYPSMRVQFKPHDRFMQTSDQPSEH